MRQFFRGPRATGGLAARAIFITGGAKKVLITSRGLWLHRAPLRYKRRNPLTCDHPASEVTASRRSSAKSTMSKVRALRVASKRRGVCAHEEAVVDGSGE
jgi:hypothetical protein